MSQMLPTQIGGAAVGNAASRNTGLSKQDIAALTLQARTLALHSCGLFPENA